MDLFKGIALFIGWLTSSFVGIGVILYACGYLVTRAQLRLLGLFGLFEDNPDYYLQEGANFFVILIQTATYQIILGLAHFGISLLFFFALGLPLAMVLFKKREQIVRLGEKWRASFVGLAAGHPWLSQNAIFVMLLFVLIIHLTSYMNEFLSTLNVSYLLYKSAADCNQYSGKAAQICYGILTPEAGSREYLDGHFHRLLWATLQAGLVLTLAWYLTSATRLRFWLTSPFIALFIMYVLYLPLAYGVLVRPIRYPVVNLTSENKVLAEVNGPLFLLKKTEHEFVLWDFQGKRALWIPNEEIKAAEVSRIQPLFGSDLREPLSGGATRK